MKQYIRLRNGQLFDTTKVHIKKEEWALESSLEILKNGHIYYYFTKDIIAESDNILDLIQVGDLIRFEFMTDDYDYHKGTIMLDKFSDYMETLKDDMKDDYIDLLELYTKQGDNYILVWDKERGVI